MAFVAAAPALWAGIASAGVAAYSGYRSSVEQKNAGIVRSEELKMQAAAEGDQARQQEIERRRNLVRALATQNARAGAAGVETGGSIGSMARTDIRDASNDLLSGQVNSGNRIRMLTSQAGNARRAGKAAATTTLLDTAGTIAGKKYG